MFDFTCHFSLFSLIVTLVKSQLQRLHIFMTLVMSYCSHYLYFKKVNYFVLALVNVIQFGKFSWRETTAQHMFLSPRPLCVEGKKWKNYRQFQTWHTLTLNNKVSISPACSFLIFCAKLIFSNWQQIWSFQLWQTNSKSYILADKRSNYSWHNFFL